MDQKTQLVEHVEATGDGEDVQNTSHQSHAHRDAGQQETFTPPTSLEITLRKSHEMQMQYSLMMPPVYATKQAIKVPRTVSSKRVSPLCARENITQMAWPRQPL